jgi:hypothetical protein
MHRNENRGCRKLIRNFQEVKFIMANWVHEFLIIIINYLLFTLEPFDKFEMKLSVSLSYLRLISAQINASPDKTIESRALDSSRSNLQKIARAPTHRRAYFHMLRAIGHACHWNALTHACASKYQHQSKKHTPTFASACCARHLPNSPFTFSPLFSTPSAHRDTSVNDWAQLDGSNTPTSGC